MLILIMVPLVMSALVVMVGHLRRVLKLLVLIASILIIQLPIPWITALATLLSSSQQPRKQYSHYCLIAYKR